ncbi:MAG TPA: twin-arginine translocation signal domain-containing protein [Terracidiphilus sp.]|nr:twin-arginine translocation signal domain-containing protein [Terracidiphilus sp.]
MTLSRRSFVADASMLGLLAALMPELAGAQRFY